MKISVGSLLAMMIAASACSTETELSPSNSASGGAGSETPLPTADCVAQCTTKATGCGAPQDVAQTQCDGICGGQATQSQLTCLSQKSCEELAGVDNPANLNSVCPASSGSSSGSNGSSSGSMGSSSGSTPPVPQMVTVTGSFGTITPMSTLNGQKVFSMLVANAKATFSPALPDAFTYPIIKGMGTIVSPTSGSCSGFVWALDDAKVSVNISGTDTLPATDCADFVKEVAKSGLTAKFANASYGKGTANVTITLKP